MSFTGTGKIWMNGSLVDWADAKIHIASHVVHYGSARVRRRPLLRHAARLGLLPARRAHAPAVRLGQDLPDGAAGRSGDADRRRSSTPSAPTSSRPATSGRSSIAATTRSASTRSLPGRRGGADVGMGRVSRPGRARAGRRRPGQLLVARRAEHVPDAGQDARPTTPTRS